MRRSETDELVAQAWGRWVQQWGEWHVFGALTYRQDPGVRPPHPEAVRKHVVKWLGKTRDHPGQFVEAAVVAVESHKSGWPHAHPLVRLRGGSNGQELAELGQAWFKRHGYAKLEVPRSADDVCQYAAKYLAKDLSRGDVILWPLRGSVEGHQARLMDVARVGVAASPPLYVSQDQGAGPVALRIP